MSQFDAQINIPNSNNKEMQFSNNKEKIDFDNNRYPHSIVWTPIPLLTWLFPFIGHMGIATSTGIIRDFAGPYYVSEDNMAFGNPTRYLQLNMDHVGQYGGNKVETWDRCVFDASEEYKKRMHNLCCDNCHSHVACALNKMRFSQSSSWNMIKLCFWMFFKGKYVSIGGFLKQWLPFLIVVTVILIIVLASHFGTK